MTEKQILLVSPLGIQGAKGDPGDLSTAGMEASAAAVEAAETVQTIADAFGGVENLNTIAAEVETARVAAETARDAATVNASVYASTSAAQADAGLAVNAQYQVVSGSEIIRYRKDSGSASTELVRYPTAAIMGLMPLFLPYTSLQLYTPDTAAALPAGAKAPANYNNGGTWGTALAYFGTTGIITGLTIGQTYTVNINDAPADVTFSRAQGGFFWTTSNVFSSQVAHNGTTMAFATGDRQVTFSAVTERVSFNLRRASTSSLMADVMAATLGALMVNAGSSALQYEPKTPVYPYVPGSRFFNQAALTDDVIVQHNGDGYFYARTNWDATNDKVQRVRFGLTPDLTANNLWDHQGERLIPAATLPERTREAFANSTTIVRGAVDEGPPFNLNGMWLAGGHGPLCRQLTITAHGFVQADIGSIWSDGVRSRVLAQIVDANNVRFIEQPTGTVTAWTVAANAVTGSTLTWVSGGVARGTKTVAADAVGQAWPFIRNRAGAVTLDGKSIAAAGVYGGRTLTFTERYDIPNLSRAISYIISNAGAADNSLIHANIGAQVRFSMAHTLDWTGIVRSVWTAEDVEAYTPGQYGGAQTLRPETPAGGSLVAYVPRSLPNGGFDFGAGRDVTTWSTSLNFGSAVWSDPTDPPNQIVFVARNSSAVPQWVHFYQLDDSYGQGKKTYRDDLSNALLFSNIRKAYVIAGGTGSASGAGQIHEAVNLVGTVAPSNNPALTWAVVYPRGAKYALNARAPSALTAQWVAVDSRLIGQPVTLVRGSVAALLTETVQDRGICITWTAAGEAEVLIG